jgi:hypothetical protein
MRRQAAFHILEAGVSRALLAIRYLADGFSPHHFKLMTKTDKIEGKESRLRAGQAVGNPSFSPWARTAPLSG